MIRDENKQLERQQIMAKTNWKQGDVAVFAGYADPNIAEADQLLKPGDRVTIISKDKEGAMAAVPIVGDGEDKRDGDTVFEDEIVTVDEWTARIDAAKGVTQTEVVDPEVAADAEAAAAPSKGKGKVKEAVKKIAEKKTKEAAPEPVAEVKAKGKKAKAEAAPAPVENEPEELEIHHSSSVQTLLAEKDALEAAKELVNRAEETEFTLGGVLAHIQREGIHQKLGYAGKRGFEDYIEQELGVKYRKARYLINIYEYFTQLGIDETRLGSIGWSKAKELVGVATKENFDDLVQFAQDNTRDALIEHIRTEYVDAGEEGEQARVKRTILKFALFEDQANTVTRALDAAKAQQGSDNADAALEFICAEWSLMSQNNETTIEEQIELLQARFGVQLQIVQPGEGTADEAVAEDYNEEAA